MLQALMHLLFPHICEVCGQDLSRREKILCIVCSLKLPASGFHDIRGNPAEKALWGRVPLQYATVGYIFHRQSPLQSLIHQFKYKGRRDVALYFGRQLGLQLEACPWIKTVTQLLPVPLHLAKLRKRGYNQAQLLAEGMSEVLGVPVWEKGLRRMEASGSQTKRSRSERWENVAEGYAWNGPPPPNKEHFLIIDDVLTTGATLEACARALLQSAPDAEVSACCLAWAGA